jgi:hypothetical protein
VARGPAVLRPPFVRLRGRGWILPVTLVLLVAILPAPAASLGNRMVVTYLTFITQGNPQHVEWRVFDPVNRRDTMFWSGVHAPSAVFWDFAWTSVEYVSDGSSWRTLWELGAQPWPETKPVEEGRAASRHGLYQLQARMSVDQWGGSPVGIRPPNGEAGTKFDWNVIPCRSLADRGVAFRLGKGWFQPKAALVPFYLLDRRQRVVRALDIDLPRDDQDRQLSMAEEDGFLLVKGPLVFDLRTGEQIFKPRGSVIIAVWTRPPKRPGTDPIGRRRLRAYLR